jgi:hypothetical protein
MNLSDADLRDFAAGLREDFAPAVFDSEEYQERLAEIWAKEDYGIDVSREIVQAVKTDWFIISALSMTFGAFGRVAGGFRSYLSGGKRSYYE